MLAELTPHLLDHGARRAANRPDGEGREHEGDRPADEETDERLGIRHVDLRLEGAPEQSRADLAELELGADGLDERGEQGHGGDDGRADGEPLGDGLGGVADGVEAHHDALGLASELPRHLGDAGGVVGDGAERVLTDHHAGGSEHAHAGQGDQVERELDVAVAEGDGDAEGHGDGDDGEHRRLEPRADAREDGGGRARARRLGDLLHGRRLRRRVVLGQAADDLGEHQADDDGAEAAPPLVGEGPRMVMVADVEHGNQGGADHRQDASGEEAPVDGRHRRLVVVGGAHGEHSDDRRQHPDGPGDEREDQAQGRVGMDRVEGGDPEDDRRHQCHLVGLEQVGRHARAVADVVTHVVSDGRRVAGIVLRDAGLDLADQVGAHVRSLGEDAPAHAHEQGEQ